MDFDVIILGSGAGGGVAAYQLASRGWKVLLIERGSFVKDGHASHPISSGLDQQSYLVNGRHRKLTVGYGLGGGTEVYGAVLMRPHEVDFAPGQHYSNLFPKAEWDWPVSFAEMRPYYEQVENLFGITPFQAQNELPAGQTAPINERLHQAWKRNHIASGILPLAIQRNSCLECEDCPGFLCPNGSRLGVRHLIERAMRSHDLEVWSGFHALQINKNRGEALLENVRTSEQKTVKASIIVVSLGAMQSPALFLRSEWEDSSGLLGRRYMYHAGGVVAGCFINQTQAGERFVKQLGTDQFYLGSPQSNNEKWGVIQSLPTPRLLPSFLRNRTYLMMATVEDIPQADNRITIDRKGNPVLHHRFHSFDLKRSKDAVRILKGLLRMGGAVGTIGLTADRNNTHVGHQVGTMCFGKNSKTSVLDPYCRPHGTERMFVLDGSFMPTSLGVGPALTIMANALRVTDWICKQYGK